MKESFGFFCGLKEEIKKHETNRTTRRISYA